MDKEFACGVWNRITEKTLYQKHHEEELELLRDITNSLPKPVFIFSPVMITHLGDGIVLDFDAGNEDEIIMVDGDDRRKLIRHQFRRLIDQGYIEVRKLEPTPSFRQPMK